MFGEIQLAMEKNNELRFEDLQTRLKALGYGLHKGQRSYPDQGEGYLIYELATTGVVAGGRYEMELEDVEDWLIEKERAKAGFVW